MMNMNLKDMIIPFEPPNGFNGLKSVQSQGSISSRVC